MTTPYSRIAADPNCYLYELDPESGAGAVLHVDRAFYRDASFLDQRAVAARRFGGWRIEAMPMMAALHGAGRADPAPHFIFHVGHCGSTLLSRVLDGLPGVHGLREPLSLLGLAHRRVAMHWQGVATDPRGDDLLSLALAMLQRPPADGERALIKTTSRVAVLARELLAWRADSRALFLFIDLEDFLAAHLRDPALTATAVDAARERRIEWRALGRRDPWPNLAADTMPDSAPEALAFLWWRERRRVEELRADPAYADRIVELDFADWRVDPPTATARVARHFGLSDDATAILSAIAAAAPERYAKDPTQTFDAASDRADREAALAANARAVVRAMAQAELWSERLREPGNA